MKYIDSENHILEANEKAYRVIYKDLCYKPYVEPVVVPDEIPDEIPDEEPEVKTKTKTKPSKEETGDK